MKLKIKTTLLAMLTLVTLALGTSSAAFAANNTSNTLTIGGGASSAQGEGQSACLFKGQEGCDADSTPIFQIVTNVLLFIIGAVSVIMLIIGGIRYTVSQGDSSAVTSAKNTILYSIVGIVVALLAYAAVNFVIGNFATNTAGAVLVHL